METLPDPDRFPIGLDGVSEGPRNRQRPVGEDSQQAPFAAPLRQGTLALIVEPGPARPIREILLDQVHELGVGRDAAALLAGGPVFLPGVEGLQLALRVGLNRSILKHISAKSPPHIYKYLIVMTFLLIYYVWWSNLLTTD